MDVSDSVDAREDALQRQGLATALNAPAVRDAFFASSDPVALAVFEWSGRQHQSMMHDWVLIDSPATLEQVAVQIANTPRTFDSFPTAMGYALGHAASILTQAPDCAAKTIDISGDGVNNDGFAPRDAIAAFGLSNITVNGLAIEVPSDAASPDLAMYFQREVINGPTAFVEIAYDFEDFSRAMEAKLIRELGVLIVGQSRRTPQAEWTGSNIVREDG